MPVLVPAGNEHIITVRICPLPGKERMNNKVQKLYLYTSLYFTFTNKGKVYITSLPNEFRILPFLF